jgi:hypothetical protein
MSELFKWDSGKEGGVSGPGSSVDGDIASFDGTTGKKLKDSGFAAHPAVTLDTSADGLLGLSTQQFSLDAQAANLVLAGPSSGSNAAPTFRALVQADLPSIDVVVANIDFKLSSYYMQRPDGWSPSDDTWTYVSSTSFKVAGKDLTAVFRKGTKIKLVQSSAWKYFYVVSSSYSTDTTVTITGGKDYTLANATITSPQYSYAQAPQTFPDRFAYNATASGTSGSAGTYAEDSADAFFWLEGGICHVLANKRITNKGSWSGDFQLLRPITRASGLYAEAVGVVMAQGGLTQKGNLAADSNNNFKFHKTLAVATLTWTDIAVNDWIIINAIYFI